MEEIYDLVRDYIKLIKEVTYKLGNIKWAVWKSMTSILH